MDMVADMEVYKVADKVADMVADMAVETKKIGRRKTALLVLDGFP